MSDFYVYGWSQKKITEIANITSGGTPSRAVSYYWNGNIPWVTPTDISKLDGQKYLNTTSERITETGLENSGAHLISAGSLLITTRASIGFRAVNILPVATNQGFKSLTFKKDYSVDFYYHFFALVTRTLERRGSGTTFLEISGTEFSKIELPCPPITEQKTISAILDTLDEAIAAAEDLLAKQEKMKQGLLQDLLTRGVDENGQLRPHWDERPDLYRKTELGWIPKAWEAKTINDLAVHVGSGVTPRGGSNVYKSSGILFIRSQNVTFQGLKLNDVAYIDSVTHQNMKSSEIVAHDVLLNITGASIGRCCPVPEGFGVANVNQHVCAIRFPEANKTDANFLSLVLSSHIGQNQIARFNAGGNREGLNYQQIRSFLIPWPDYPERENITEHLVVQKDENIVVFQELEKLKKIKTGLMQDLLTGRRRVTPELIQQVETLTRSAD